MKILHVITSLRTGGAEKLMVDIIPRIKQRGFEVDLLLFDGVETPFKLSAKEKGINIIELGQNKSAYSIRNLFKLIPFLKKYDIVHTHNTAPQLFAAIGSMLCSVVLCTTEHNTSNRRRGRKWYAPIDKWMYSRYKRIICISPKTEKALRESIDVYGDKIITISNGIPVSTYIGAEKTYLNIDCSFKIVQVAGFRYQKDQDTVIRAMQLLPEEIHLFLVGDGVRRAEIENQIEGLGLEKRIHLLGIRSDIPSILSSADVVVMSSHYEGFGLAAVEGMAAAKPVIASDVDGLREVVHGAGILFEHGNDVDLATQIVKLYNNPDYYRTIAQKCRVRANDYDISKMVDGYVEVYNSLIHENNTNLDGAGVAE